MNAQIVHALLDAFRLIVPEGILVGVACVLFLGATFWPNRHLWAGVSFLALFAAGLALLLGPAGEAGLPSMPMDEGARAALFASPLRLDSLAWFVKAISIGGGLVLVLLSWNEVPDRVAAEYHACLLVIVAGMCLTGSANELVTLFLALEMISIPTYILLYLPRYDNATQEAAMKYFLLSVFSSAMLLFGFSYLYGLAGTTNLPAMTEALYKTGPERALPAVVQIALVMVVAGLSFRITAVPFHFYAPDVYQGAPTVGAALLAFVPKVAGFVALFRVLGFVLPGLFLVPANSGEVVPGLALGRQVPMLLWILAAVTMTLGNVLALLQDNLKRILAYSSVAHAGYMLIGLATAPYLSQGPAPVPGGVDAILFYLISYGAMTVGTFAVIAYLSTPPRPVETVDDLAGLSRSHPGVAMLMAVFMFSLIGMPLTGGFVGKLLLFLGAMTVSADQGASPDQAMLYRWLALIGVLNAAIGGWYYLRIIAVIYLRPPLHPLEKRTNWPTLAAVWVCAAFTLILGIYPWPFVRSAENAVPRLSPERAAQTAER